ncbi:hypothetical protein [Kamptonema formosum]|uniref:hypothetical protein n=1 Tax=Kamptonema formosum TaxID=331992 RepID=UPI000344AEEE|nr:hypothetical protein [Oscillatoria sp. PCC 10802]
MEAAVLGERHPGGIVFEATAGLTRRTAVPLSKAPPARYGFSIGRGLPVCRFKIASG